VGKLKQFYKVPSSRVLVIADDLDLALGTVRLKARGGHGGHNGLRSIVQHLGGGDAGQAFPRIKVGIGRPPGQMAVADFVLQRFGKDEAAAVDGAVADALALVKAALALGVEKAMSGHRVP